MNKKGQVLVMFVLLLPILFIGIYLLYIQIDLANEKKNQVKLAEYICDYYQKNNSIDKVIEYSNKLDDTQSIEIKEEKKSIKINIVKEKSFVNRINRIETKRTCKKGKA